MESNCGMLYSYELRAELAECSDSCALTCFPTQTSSPFPFIRVTPWQSAFDEGADAAFTPSEAAELSNTATCFERYPPPPASPCHDTSGLP